jgi:FSR family fosmidomycin resistance protein-like MFS transporter
MRQFRLNVLLLLSAGHMTVDLYQGALPAILPFLKDRLALSYTTAGFIMIVANFTSSILQPLFGLLSDKKEKGFLLPLGTLAAGVGYSLLSLPSHYAPLLVLVILSGLGVSAYHPEGYKTAGFFTGDRPATGMSIFSVGGNLGFALGPTVVIWVISRFGFHALPLVVIPSLIFTAIIIMLRKTVALPEKGPHVSRDGERTVLPGARLSLAITIGVVIMRSWTQIGIMAYIPSTSSISCTPTRLRREARDGVPPRGRRRHAGGAPIADRWGHRRVLRVSMFITIFNSPSSFS